MTLVWTLKDNNSNWGQSSFCMFPSYLTSEPNPNVGASAVMVVSDPLRDSDPTVTDTEIETAKRRIRRKLMTEYASEYATLNRDLLRELAR